MKFLDGASESLVIATPRAFINNLLEGIVFPGLTLLPAFCRRRVAIAIFFVVLRCGRLVVPTFFTAFCRRSVVPSFFAAFCSRRVIFLVIFSSRCARSLLVQRGSKRDIGERGTTAESSAGGFREFL